MLHQAQMDKALLRRSAGFGPAQETDSEVTWIELTSFDNEAHAAHDPIDVALSGLPLDTSAQGSTTMTQSVLTKSGQ